MNTSQQIDLCYVISHGFAARMLLQTGLLLQLAEQGKQVAIITPDPKDPNFKALESNPNIHLFDSQMKLTIWDDDYNFKRPYYLEDLKSNPVFWEKHLYSILYSKSKHPWKRVRPFYYYLIYRLIPFFPSIRRRFKETEGRHLRSKRAETLLDQIQPRMVVSTYPVNYLESKMLYAAKQRKIPTMIHLLSWDNITSKGHFPVVADYFIAWGEVMYQELKEYYQLPDERIRICGVPHFDQHIRIRKQPDYAPIVEGLGLKAERPYVFVAMSSPRFAPREIDIVEWLARAVDEGRFGPEMQLIVRPHPQNVQGSLADRKWIKRLDRLQSERVAVDYPTLVKSKVRWSMAKEDMHHLSNLLAGCSVCINSGSTVSIDALMLGKPVMISSFDGDAELYYWKSARRLVDYIHLQKFVQLGGAKVVYNYEELEKGIKRYIKEPGLDAERRQHALSMECYRNDGGATERVVEAVKEILEKIEAKAAVIE
ncbi:MAG: CDP-glycerol glycerophosphotransferase family protein [Bacteroidota bacterium]